MILMEQLKSIKRELGLERDDKAALVGRFQARWEPKRARAPEAVARVVQVRNDEMMMTGGVALCVFCSLLQVFSCVALVCCVVCLCGVVRARSCVQQAKRTRVWRRPARTDGLLDAVVASARARRRPRPPRRARLPMALRLAV